MNKELDDHLYYYRPVQPEAEDFINEPNLVELRFKPGPDIDEFKHFCAVLALQLGYSSSIVKNAFGSAPRSITKSLIFKILKYNKK
jgi:hypothetical protein